MASKKSGAVDQRKYSRLVVDGAKQSPSRAMLRAVGDPAVLSALAPRYRNSEVGELTIRAQDGGTWLKAGVIDAPVATRRNPDGSVSVVTIGPGAIGLEALVGEGPDGKTLTIRDSQHEYVYVAAR